MTTVAELFAITKDLRRVAGRLDGVALAFGLDPGSLVEAPEPPPAVAPPESGPGPQPANTPLWDEAAARVTALLERGFTINTVTCLVGHHTEEWDGRKPYSVDSFKKLVGHDQFRTRNREYGPVWETELKMSKLGICNGILKMYVSLPCDAEVPDAS